MAYRLHGNGTGDREAAISVQCGYAKPGNTASDKRICSTRVDLHVVVLHQTLAPYRPGAHGSQQWQTIEHMPMPRASPIPRVPNCV
jgi:hypothetical protein